MRHEHINGTGEVRFHEHIEPTTQVHYPGEGLDAATEAFNAYKLWREKLARLSTEELVPYSKSVVEYNVQRGSSWLNRARNPRRPKPF